MNGWIIEWYAEEWRIEHQPNLNLLIVVEYDDEYVEQDPIRVVRLGKPMVKIPWPWSHDVSPQPDEVIAELRRIAAEYMEGAK